MEKAPDSLRICINECKLCNTECVISRKGQKMQTIAIAAQKGGTGKTTTAATMAAGLTLKGYKVLLIDLDQQGSLSFICKADANSKTTLGILTREITAEEAIQHLEIADIIPANKSLAGAEAILKDTGGEYRLKEAIEPIRGKYDFIIIDCPPALGSLTINALAAADKVIIPAQADVLSLAGITQLYDSCNLVKKYINKNLEIAGILLAKHSNRAVIKRDLEEVLREQIAQQMNSKVYKATIREAVAINEAQYMQQSIFNYAKNSNVSNDYKAFIDEFLEDIKGE